MVNYTIPNYTSKEYNFYFTSLRKLINNVYKSVAEYPILSASINFDLFLNPNDFNLLIKDIYLKVGVRIQEQTLKDLTRISKKSIEEFTPSFIEQRMIEYIDSIILDKVTGIVQTIKNNILDVLRSAFEVGKSPKDIQKELLKKGLVNSKQQAEAIARTEMTSARSVGSIIAAEKSGVVKTKKWRSGRAGRTRQSHLAANGQEVPFDGKFTVGNSLLRYPADQQGEAKEVVNCRCFMVFGVGEQNRF